MASVRMYTKRWCGYCSAARSLLGKKNVAYEEIDIGGQNDLRDEMIRLSGRTTVPQIFVDGVHLGGFDDIAALDARGELDRILGLGESGSS